MKLFKLSSIFDFVLFFCFVSIVNCEYFSLKDQVTNSVFNNNSSDEDLKKSFEWTIDNYPNPFENYKDCALNEKGYICDPDQVLEEDDIKKLKKSIESLNSELRNFCPNQSKKQGLDFGIAIMEKFKKYPNKTLRDTANDFAQKLLQKWNLGSDCGNGFIIFQSSAYNILTFSIGKQIQKVIKNSTINEIYSNFGEPMLSKDENVFTSIKTLLDSTLQNSFFINKNKVVEKVNDVANKNPKLQTVINNLNREIEKKMEEDLKLKSLENTDKTNTLNSEQILIYFFTFILILIIACLFLNCALKKPQNQTRNPSMKNNNQLNFNLSSSQYSDSVHNDTLYKSLPNNEITKNKNEHF